MLRGLLVSRSQRARLLELAPWVEGTQGISPNSAEGHLGVDSGCPFAGCFKGTPKGKPLIPGQSPFVRTSIQEASRAEMGRCTSLFNLPSVLGGPLLNDSLGDKRASTPPLCTPLEHQPRSLESVFFHGSFNGNLRLVLALPSTLP